MRFDDSLKTVLAADMSTGFGASAAWRQLVDLMGRRRIAADEPALARLRVLRQGVPAPVRAASARALAYADPGAGLVGFFAEDELAIAAPVLRTATLPAADWLAMLPRLSPSLRAVLRHRRDLPVEVGRGLASFGAVDFVIESASPASKVLADIAEEPSAPVQPPLDTLLSETPFQVLGDVARGLPVVAEALRRTERSLPDEIPPAPAEPNGYAISDLVARIEAFTRNREAGDDDVVPRTGTATGFRFETDAAGVVRVVEGVSRAALVGLSFATGAVQGLAQVDGVVAGAFRRRSRFEDARLRVDGMSDAAGSWRLTGVPMFDAATGRFTGYRGSARRPRTDEAAEPRGRPHQADVDSLRQLVHELRTPTNAIVGFAELIEMELLGPVSPTYRARAGTIRAHAADLVAAIEDLDTAARIEGDALELRPGRVAPVSLVERILADLEPLAGLRGSKPLLSADPDLSPIAADDRAAERLVSRLLATAIAAGAAGERIGIAITQRSGMVSIAVDRPRGLVPGIGEDETLFSLDPRAGHDELTEGAHGAPLLGAAFALRLARNLAGELGGSLSIDADRLTLRLPAAVDRDVGQTTTS